MTFADLISQVTQKLFPDGEADNLVGNHRAAFVQAMCDLQNAIPCLRYGNTEFYHQCGTYFNCGLTVLTQPPGQVLRVCTVGKQNSSKQTQIADVTVTAPLLQVVNGVLSVPNTTGTLCSISADGVYSITVQQTNKFSALYAANSPQYFRTQITYTDTSGIVRNVQPASPIYLNNSSISGTLTVDIKGGTSVSYTITPNNIPQADGQIQVEMIVNSGNTGASDDDWCSKVYYEQVEYSEIERYVHACRDCGAQSSAWQLWTAANAIVANLFGKWRVKRRYTPPTNIGFENLPPLPPGFYYPQSSTDAGGRSHAGVYAIKHGRIYIAPWIESTESVIVEWNGLKNNWADSDLVSDDPQFKEAVTYIVGIDHYTHYEDNQERLNNFEIKLRGSGKGNPGIIRELVSDCRERIRVRSSKELFTNDGDAAGGIGITTGTTSSAGIFYSAAQSYTTTCPQGQIGCTPVTVMIPAGAFSSSLSQADADNKALSQAQQNAQSQSQANQTPGVTLFSNTSQSYTAICPAANGAQGSQVTVTIPTGTFQSVASQDIADAAALASATAQAQAQLSCTYFNAQQTVQVTCGDSTHQSATIPAGQYTSTKSQADADAKATAAAQAVAVSQCSVPPGAFTIGNTALSIPYSIPVSTTCGTTTASGTVNVPANFFMGQCITSTQSQVQSQLNGQALAFGQQEISAAVSSYKIQQLAICLQQRQSWQPVN